MKKIYLIIFIVAVSITSCSDFLDVSPDNRALVDSEKKITSLLVSAYSDQSYWLLCELSSDNADDNGGTWTSISPLEMQAFTWAETSEDQEDSPQAIWDGYYHAIASANQALQAINELGNPESLNPQKGEALICRAYSHFILVNVFCKAYGNTSTTDLGIPYMEKTETHVSPKYERGNVEDVYTKINADIEAGLPLIDDKIYSVSKFHFNKKAAYAFASRFNLFYRKYDKVINYAKTVLSNSPTSVLRDWKYGGSLSYNDNFRPDWYVSKDNKASLLYLSTFSLWGRIHGPYSSGSQFAHNSFISATETLGSSGPWGTYNSFYFKRASYSSLPKDISRKYAEYFEYTDPVNGIGYAHIVQTEFTTDETLLCRAEAYALKKDFVNAAKDLTTFMNAYSSAGSSMTQANINSYYNNLAYYTPKVPTPKKQLNADFTIEPGEQENFIHCILHIRRILTMHEGLRWFDIKRYGIELYRRKVEDGLISVSQNKLTVDDPRRAIQLPQNVINAGITANPR